VSANGLLLQKLYSSFIRDVVTQSHESSVSIVTILPSGWRTTRIPISVKSSTSSWSNQLSVRGGPQLFH